MIEGLLSKYYPNKISGSPPSSTTQAIRYAVEVFLYKTAADKFPDPWKYLLLNPFITAAIVLVLYIVFCVIYVPLWLASFLVTIYGSVAIFFIILHLLTVFIARNLAFPGGNSSFHKEVSSDYIRRLSHQLESLAIYTANFTAKIMLVVNNQIGRNDMNQVYSKLQEIVGASANLPPLIVSLRKASDEVIDSKKCKPAEIDEISRFLRTVEAFEKALSEFVPEMIQLLGPNDKRQGIKRQQFIVLAGRCLQASDNLRSLTASLRPNKGDEDLLSIVKRMLFEGGPRGIGKLSLPAMRNSLSEKYGAIPLPIKGENSNKLSVMIFPANLASLSPINSGSQHIRTLSDYVPSKVGVTLICNPNAAFIESLSMISLESSWLGFYLSMGFDVCCFNYRGYGSSEGYASPSSLKSDAMIILNYIKKELHADKILVHGESIGGMVGCHVARHGQVDLFVGDRTFSSLDALAARMLGSPIGLCLRYLGLWFTDSVADYLDIKCPKVIIQDPADAVIFNPASLKVGIAAKLLLGDAYRYPAKFNHNYVLADAMGQPLPNRNKEDDMLKSLDNRSFPVSEECIQHFYACLVHITRCSAHEKKRQELDVIPNTSSPACSSMSPRKHVSDIVNSDSSPYHDPDNFNENLEEEEENSYVMDDFSVHGSSKDNNFSSYEEWLKHYSNINILEDPSLDDYQKAWMSISLLAGHDGQLLGQAFTKGYDGVRAWICSYLIWSTRSISDVLYEGTGSNIRIRSAIQNLKSVVELFEKKRLFIHISSSSINDSPSNAPIIENDKMNRGFQSVDSSRRGLQRRHSNSSSETISHPDLESVVDSIKFICQAFIGFENRIDILGQRSNAVTTLHGLTTIWGQSIPQPFYPNISCVLSESIDNAKKSKGLVESGSVTSSSLVDVDDLDVRSYSSSSSDSGSSLVKLPSNSKLMKGYPVPFGVDSTTSLASDRSNGSSNLKTFDIGIGCLVPTHAGHSVWLANHELSILKEFVRSAGFDIR